SPWESCNVPITRPQFNLRTLFCLTICVACFLAGMLRQRQRADDHEYDQVRRAGSFVVEVFDPCFQTRLDEGKLIDLTHPFDEHTIYWPTEPGFQLQKGPAGKTSNGYFYAANRFASAEHGGTHIDAPYHFNERGQTVDKLPLRQLMGDAVVIDVSSPCADDPDYEISIADLRGWEEKHQQQLPEAIVLLRTGFARHWPNRQKYLGTDETGPDAVKKLHFPGLAPAAARWLVEQRLIKAIGIDTASIDAGQSTHFGSHVKLFEHNVPVFENLANLADLPETGCSVIALPMNIKGGTGAPLRIVAIVPPSDRS
ncbi:MAG TPA: cyclase family protein, partial [Pirellulales bacterium]|nr:cyclase family protein [Pirellulales bacterium]